MEQAAYDLSRFETSDRRPIPRVHVAKRESNARQKQIFAMLRTLLTVMLFVGMVSAVLYTQATITELQGEITQAEKQLAEEKSLNAYLSFELDNMTSLKNIEQTASSMGMEKINNGQIVYFRSEEGDIIQVREGLMSKLFGKARSGFLSIVDYVSPP